MSLDDVCDSYLKLLVSSLFCSHLQTCRFLHLSNRSEVFTLEDTQRERRETQTTRKNGTFLQGLSLHSRSGPLERVHK